MPRLDYDGRSYDRTDGESVLDALLRQGVEVSHACKAGACGSCLMQVRPPSSAPSSAQRGLRESWAAQGYFLACSCQPDGDFAAGPVGEGLLVPAVIHGIEPLSASVLRVRLTPSAPFDYRAGQYVTVIRQDGLARSYSLASLSDDATLELHVRLLPNGRMSQWLAGEATPGTPVQLLGPSGGCFYVGGRPEQPLLLAGTGTGLAPLVGIARDAIRSGHVGPIHLVHGALALAGFYLHDELSALHEACPAFTVCQTAFESEGPIEKVIAQRFPSLTGYRAFVCGDPEVVRTLTKRIFVAGAAFNDIHSDAFVPSAS